MEVNWRRLSVSSLAFGTLFRFIILFLKKKFECTDVGFIWQGVRVNELLERDWEYLFIGCWYFFKCCYCSANVNSRHPLAAQEWQFLVRTLLSNFWQDLKSVVSQSLMQLACRIGLWMFWFWSFCFCYTLLTISSLFLNFQIVVSTSLLVEWITTD